MTGKRFCRLLRQALCVGIVEHDPLGARNLPIKALEGLSLPQALLSQALAQAANKHGCDDLAAAALSLVPHVHAATVRAELLARMAEELLPNAALLDASKDRLLEHVWTLCSPASLDQSKSPCLLRVAAVLLRMDSRERQILGQRFVQRAVRMFGHAPDGADFFAALAPLHHRFGKADAADALMVYYTTCFVSCLEIKDVTTYARARDRLLEEQRKAPPPDLHEPLPDLIRSASDWFRRTVLTPYGRHRSAMDTRLQQLCIGKSAHLQPDSQKNPLDAYIAASLASLGARGKDLRWEGDIRYPGYLESDQLRDVWSQRYMLTMKLAHLARAYKETTFAELRDARKQEPLRVATTFNTLFASLEALSAGTSPRTTWRDEGHLAGHPAALPTQSDATLDATLLRIEAQLHHETADKTEPAHLIARVLPELYARVPRTAIEQAVADHLNTKLGIPSDAGLGAYLGATQRLVLALLSGELLCGRLDAANLAFWQQRVQNACTLPAGEQAMAAAFLCAIDRADNPLREQDAAKLLGELPRPVLRACTRTLLSGDGGVCGRIWRRLFAVRRTELTYGGATVSTFASAATSILRTYAEQVTTDDSALQPDGQTVSEATSPPLWRPADVAVLLEKAAAGCGDDTNDLEAGVSVWGCRGRTLILRHGARFVACKLKRPDEPVAVLHHELAMQRHFCERNAQSLIPCGIGVFGHDEAPFPEQLLALLTASGVEVARPTTYLVYASDDSGLWSYVNEVDVEQRREGLRRAAVDLFAWARDGTVMRALTVKSHNVEASRRYEWIIDLCVPPHQRRGMGRLDHVPRALGFPNVRQTGVADLAEMTELASVVAEARARETDHDSHKDPIPSLVWLGSTDLLTWIHRLRFLGDYLLDLTLLAADGWRRAGLLGRGDGRWSERVADLTTEIRDIWITCYTSYTQAAATEAAALLDGTVDFAIMAKQLAYFLDPENYADEFDKTLHIEPEIDERTRHSSPYHATRCDAEADALARKLETDLYADELRVHIDLTGHPEQWVSPKQKQPDGIAGFSLDGHHIDVGTFNGPWTFIELERGLFAVGCLMLAATA